MVKPTSTTKRSELEHTVIEIIDKKIEHIQKAIQFLDAACEDDLQFVNNRLGRKIAYLQRRKKSLESDFNKRIKLELDSQ